MYQNLRVLKCFEAQCRKVVEATRIPNTTKEPLEATPQEANAQVLTKAMNLLSALHVFHVRGVRDLQAIIQ